MVIPHGSGLTGLLRPLATSVFGALKAEYRAIYRRECPRGRTKADFAAYLILAWERISERAIQHGWECFDAERTRLEAELRDAVGQ